MISQFGYAVAYPDQFGVDNFSSTMCSETARAQCVNYVHPENKCKQVGVHEPSPISGTCNYPSCDCTEWLHVAANILIGQEPASYYPLMPQTRDGLLATLSQDFKDVWNDPQYHMLRRPIPWSYSP